MIGIPSEFVIGGVKYTVEEINNPSNNDWLVSCDWVEATIKVQRYYKGKPNDTVRALKFYDILFSLFFERIGRYNLSKDEQLCMAFARHYLSFRNSFKYNLKTILYPKSNTISILNKFGEFIIGGVKYVILATQYLDSENKGQVNTGTCTITIPTYSKRAILTFRDKINTIYHELFHVMSSFSDREDYDLFNDEFITSSIADFLTEYEISICNDTTYEGVKFNYWKEFEDCYNNKEDSFLYNSIIFN